MPFVPEVPVNHARSPEPPDPLGHELLAGRLAQIPTHVAEMLKKGPLPHSSRTLASERFIVTGTGSSEAHARYLCNLVNLYTDRSAAFLPLSGFLGLNGDLSRDKTLVVFSQGLSPNAQIALRRHTDFRHSVLFSSTTAESAMKAGKADRAELITAMQSRGGDLIVFPLAEEYTTLIRLIGPMCGYLACLQFVAGLHDSRIGIPSAQQLLPLLDLPVPPELLTVLIQNPEPFSRGFNLITAAPISDYSQNLACKFMEGLFWPCPPISDFLQFAHGPFQQATVHKRPVIVLQGGTDAEAQLVERSRSMLGLVGLPCFVVRVNAPPLLSIFGFEAIFNRLIMDAMRAFHVDQVNWPGKGRDDLLYGFCSDKPSSLPA